jgi:hypothetical protein
MKASVNAVDRREFIIKSSAATSFMLICTSFKAFPLLGNKIINILEEADEDELKSFVLKSYGDEVYKTLNFQDNLNALWSNHYINFGEVDSNNNYKPTTIDRISKSKPVSLDDVYKACNYKESVIDDVFPKLNTLFQSAFIGFGVAGLAAYSTGGLSVVLADLTLAGMGVLNGAFIEGIFEKVKKDNMDLCKRTVDTYYKSNKQKKSFLESDLIEKKTKIPFKSKTKDLQEKLPSTHPTRTISTKNSTDNKEQILLTVTIDLMNQYSSFHAELSRANTHKERQIILNNLNYLDNELSSAIYLGKNILQILFNDSEFASDFYSVSMSIKDAYISYTKFNLPIPEIGPMAFAASWVSAGTTIISILSKNGETKLWKSLFSQLKALTDLVVKGFNAILENQKTMLQQLNSLTEHVIISGKIEQSILRSLNDKIDVLNNKIDLFEYNQSMKDITSSCEQLSTLFNDKKFDIRKEDYRIAFNKYVTDFVVHSNSTSKTSGSISGYSLSTNGTQLKEIININTPFEYQIGKIPVALASLNIRFSNFQHDKFIQKLANPIEWNRGADLYLQAHLITKSDSQFVTNHLNQFIESGSMIQQFCKEFTNKSFIDELADIYKTLSIESLDIFINYTQQRLLANKFQVSIAPYRTSLKWKTIKLDRLAFTPVEPGSGSNPRPGTIEQRKQKRLKYYKAIETAFADNTLYTLINEIDNNDKFPEHRADAISIDIFDIFNKAHELGVINFTASTIYGGPYHSAQTIPHNLYTCEFIDGNFKGLSIKFLYNKNKYTRTFPLQEGKSQYDGREYISMEFDGPNNRIINPVSWRVQAKSIISSKNLANSYFKLRLLNSSLDSLDMNFVEFLINEVLHKGDRIKDIVKDKSAFDYDFLYRTNLNKADHLDTIGYLLTNILTVKEYSSNTSAFNDYRDITLRNKKYTNPLIYLPKYAFFEELFKIFNTTLSEDFINEALNSDKWKSYKTQFTDDSDKIEPVLNYIRNEVMQIIIDQRTYMMNIEIGNEPSNYNIYNTMYILTKLKDKLSN